jgi:ElaB/YqjD/DUF883 family membrane-anchored ribosome-binding protein
MKEKKDELRKVEQSGVSALDERKEQLRKEIEELEAQLEASVNGVGDEVSEQFEPKKIIQKHPFKALGVSILAGFLITYRSRSAKSSVLWSALKKELADQAIDYATHIVRSASKKNED